MVIEESERKQSHCCENNKQFTLAKKYRFMVTCEKMFRFGSSYVTNIMNYNGSQATGGSVVVAGNSGDSNSQFSQTKKETPMPWKISFEERVQQLHVLLRFSFSSFSARCSWSHITNEFINVHVL